ncbi:MAG: ABC transporter ATP-binding protein [Anaerolineae bacterium]|nr:ABC transporter ATP-binding protein [Thermoflexus sp.]MDW8064032.1 ABC transporter ATP-binding protein [Anaerolineae bacterium]
MLRVEDLQVAYENRVIVAGLSFCVEPGQVLGLIGPNGAGKTTVIRALSGVIPIQRGTIFWEDVPLYRLSPEQRARWIAVVPQGASLPEAFTGEEVVSFGRTPYLSWLSTLSEADRMHIEQAMIRTETQAFAEQRVGMLSGGERQRLLIARALAQTPRVLLLDEAFAHLDLKYQIRLLQLIRQTLQAEKMAGVLAIHDLHLAARFCDQLLLLKSGRALALGPVEKVLRPALLEAAYEIPMRVDRHPEAGWLIWPG